MVSNQVLQKTIEELKAITKVNLAALSLDGTVAAATSEDVREKAGLAVEFARSPADSQMIQEVYFFKVYDDRNPEYILLSWGGGENAYMIGKIAVCQIQNLIIAYKERLDRNNFIQNLLLDNLLLVDIYNRAKKLHISAKARRVVYMIETGRQKDSTALEAVRGLFLEKNGDYITVVDEDSIILVKELNQEEGLTELDQTAQTIADRLESLGEDHVRIAYGNPVTELKDVSRSYKEAKMALDVGKIFYPDKQIAAYTKLGIGRLVYQLPLPLCQMFMKEVFGDQLPEAFDEETLVTINKFFENSLNVSETARQLYVHRNTLVYRLEKIQKSTGLDIREFDDALTFKIAMMVVSYMKYMEQTQEF
ncbi:MAG TPA: helix-turn-helix domain-containing protein [Candidatus Egerieimonas intestinavium]|uniref:Helix-turn-helix domain-containing protein n=1 Tax=Candidatus Egerieimonas intestinavium TaxID=2840777 RepID=A0A9D1EHG6_9FIRM|nr:helix-turn-helix domain-containing protein [Candidatus Egerieimonas intestinavium]